VNNKSLKKKVQLILGTQEEVEWTDMDAYVAEYPLPDYGFSPDGEYPICNIEKGCADYTLEFDVNDNCNQLHIVSIDCGTMQNSVPAKAVAMLSDGREVIATGKTVHSCQPELGENALFNLYDKLTALGVVENRLMKLLKEISGSFSSIYGKELGLYSESEYYQGEFVHRNVFSPTIFKAENGKAILNINCRFPYGESEANLLSKIQEFAHRNHGKVTEVYAMPAVFVSKEKPFLKVFAESYEEVTGLTNEFTLAHGGSYAKAMPNIVSWGPIFPGEEDTCHEANEYISIDSLIKNTEIFAYSIAKITLSDESFK
jgi:succinyl-diaminopimelate desuccinylase